LNQKLPQHVAIIMDGNGRWAESRGLSRSEGHRAGVGVVKDVVRLCLEKGIPVVSLWAFGSDNWSRPAAEVAFLMELFLHALDSDVDELYQNGVRLCFTGDRSQLSLTLSEQMRLAEQLTQDNDRLLLNVVINYGGKWDIMQAVKKLAGQIATGETLLDDIDEPMFAQLLSASHLPDPDLFIRTSGEQRISNFFLWQLAYTELYFSEVYWPDFTHTEFEKALAFFSARERRYGQTSQQIREQKYV